MLNLSLKTALTLVFIISSLNADSNKDRSFINIENPIPCIRRFNATHQIGCAKSDIAAYEGIVLAVRNTEELKKLTSINLNGNEVIVVTVSSMYSSVVDFYLKYRSNSFINGIVLIANGNETEPAGFSDDSPRPNERFGLYVGDEKNLDEVSRSEAGNLVALRTIDWNLVRTNSYMYESFEIPIYVITEDEQANKIISDCYEKFNKMIFDREDSKLSISSVDLVCGMQLGLDMSGAINSEVCIRRETIQHTVDTNQFCDPLGGMTYFTYLSQQPTNEKPIAIVSARLDTFTMYEYYTPGANEPISSIIGLLAVAELLARNREGMDQMDVLFTFFDNEAFEYGGSSRFVNDLILDQFPEITITNSSSDTGTSSFKLNKKNLKTIIELNQLGSVGLSDDNKLFIHRDPLSYSSSETIAGIIDELTTNLTAFSSDLIKRVLNLNQELAPSSIHSFLRQNISIAGILITDHEEIYANKHFHSIFDTPKNLQITFPENMNESDSGAYTTKMAKRLQVALTGIAKTVYFQSTSKSLDQEVDITFLNNLVYCFYKNTTCQFFKNMMTDDQWKVYDSLLQSQLPKYKLSFYTSVNNAQISGKWLAQTLLKYVTRNKKFEVLNSTDCNKNSDQFNKLMKDNNLSPTNINYINGICVGSSLYAVSSVSPAFKNQLNGELIDIDKFSAWTESSWNGRPVQMRLFMFANEAIRVSTIVIGIATLLISFGITLVANRLSNKWFRIKHPEQTDEIIEN